MPAFPPPKNRSEAYHFFTWLRRTRSDPGIATFFRFFLTGDGHMSRPKGFTWQPSGGGPSAPTRSQPHMNERGHRMQQADPGLTCGVERSLGRRLRYVLRVITLRVKLRGGSRWLVLFYTARLMRPK